MIKGVKIRFEIHNILLSVYKFNKALNNSLIKIQISKQKKEDIAFLHNVTLNSMRLHLHCLKIINKFIVNWGCGGIGRRRGFKIPRRNP